MVAKIHLKLLMWSSIICFGPPLLFAILVFVIDGNLYNFWIIFYSGDKEFWFWQRTGMYYWVGVFPTLLALSGEVLLEKYTRLKNNFLEISFFLQPLFVLLSCVIDYYIFDHGGGGQFGDLFGYFFVGALSFLISFTLLGLLYGWLFMWQKIIK